MGAPLGRGDGATVRWSAGEGEGAVAPAGSARREPLHFQVWSSMRRIRPRMTRVRWNAPCSLPSRPTAHAGRPFRL